VPRFAEVALATASLSARQPLRQGFERHTYSTDFAGIA
jgi:hypothetical protein